MTRKTLAGWAFLTSAVILLAIGGPNYGRFPSKKGLPSQAERQTSGKEEGNLTQNEKAGGIGNGESYGRLQSGTLKYHIGIRGQPSRNNRAPAREGKATRLDGSPTGLLESILLNREGKKPHVRRSMDQGNNITEEASKTLADCDTVVSRGTDSRRNDSHNSQCDIYLITAYTAGKESTGKSPGDKGYGITATGTQATEGRTIGADWKVLPPGTIVEIEGLPGHYVVEDTGAGAQGKHIDLFIKNLKAALKWGRQYREVRVISKN